MTVDPRIEGALPRILADLGAGPAPDYTDRLLERTARVRQRPAWVFSARWLGVDAQRSLGHAGHVPWRAVGFVLLLVAAIVAVALGAALGAHRLPAPFGPARNGLVTFATEGDIYIGDPTNGTFKAIAAGPDYDFGPFFSSEGTRIAFFRRVDPMTDGATNIVVERSDGKDARVITSVPLGEIPWQAKWAPDGKTIAVVTNDRGDGKLVMYDATGATPGRVIDTHGILVDGVAFQPPDGRQILFRGQSGYLVGLYVMNPDGSDITALIKPYTAYYVQDDTIGVIGWPWTNGIGHLGELRDPIWSPDGTRIVFRQYAYVDGDYRLRLMEMNADGTGTPQPIGYTIGDLLDAYATWSPDGSRIAFMRYREPVGVAKVLGKGPFGAWDSAVVRLSDGKMTTRIGPPIPDGLAALEWSPDGKQLLLVEHSGERKALLLDPNGGSPPVGLPWTVESNGWWQQRFIPNGIDLSGWQRLATP